MTFANPCNQLIHPKSANLCYDPPYYVPEGDSPLSLQATAQLSRAVVSASASKHRAGVRATIPAVQVRGECSCGAGRGSLSARLEPHGWSE